MATDVQTIYPTITMFEAIINFGMKIYEYYTKYGDGNQKKKNYF